MKNFIVILLFNFLENCNLLIRSNSIIWDDEQIYTNWIQAEALCRNKGMRLPDYKEIAMAKKTKLTDEWRKEINIEIVQSPAFWISSNHRNDAGIFPIHIPDEGVQIWADKKSKKLVRCVRD
ncbi:MAG: sulfatase [Leptospiraceae bacterium]|nr:sulfatase [Leptospiraceae bacterium]